MSTQNLSESDKLHVFFLPFMAHGHMIPMLDIAKLFASRNLKAIIVTTPLNYPLVSRQIKNSVSLGLEIDVQLIDFPTTEAGLPEGCEHLDEIGARQLGWEGKNRFYFATTLLQNPLEKLLENTRPDLLVADQFYPWATDSASKFGIPRLVSHGNCFFAMCACISVEKNIFEKQEEYLNIMSDPMRPFVIPDLPDEIKVTGNQLPKRRFSGPKMENEKILMGCRKSEMTSLGVIVNSFYELEPAYADHYTNVLGRRTWTIGPVSLYNRNAEEKARRGNQVAINEHECLAWLNSKKPGSVIYVCFGSETNFSATNLKEIALGLESSGHDFIWAVKRWAHEDTEDNWLPERFEERMEGKGLIIRGWAPQVVILGHEAIGGFVTHCGWNSTLEAIAAGVPMVTWPNGAEQFYNEKLVTDVLKIGIAVGVEQMYQNVGNNGIKSESVKKAVNRVMEGEEAEEMRKKAKKLGEMAKKAIEEGGSSHSDMDALIDQLKRRKNK